MRRFSVVLALVASFALAGSVFAAPSQTAKGTLTCFATSPGVCTIVSNVATLDTRLGGTSGVYYVGSSGKSFYGQRLSQIGALSFTYSGTLGVDPHWSVPIDTDGDGNTDLYALVPSNTCTNGSGLVDVIKDTTCEIFRTDNTTASYPNWDAFVVAVGLNAKVSLVDKTASVIADRGLGLWTVSNVVVGKPGK